MTFRLVKACWAPSGGSPTRRPPATASNGSYTQILCANPDTGLGTESRDGRFPDGVLVLVGGTLLLMRERTDLFKTDAGREVRFDAQEVTTSAPSSPSTTMTITSSRSEKPGRRFIRPCTLRCQLSMREQADPATLLPRLPELVAALKDTVITDIPLDQILEQLARPLTHRLVLKDGGITALQLPCLEERRPVDPLRQLGEIELEARVAELRYGRLPQLEKDLAGAEASVGTGDSMLKYTDSVLRRELHDGLGQILTSLSLFARQPDVATVAAVRAVLDSRLPALPVTAGGAVQCRRGVPLPGVS